MNMIEKVARAAAAELGKQDDGHPFKLDDDLKLDYLDQGEVDFRPLARAALEAMRTPTDDMFMDATTWAIDNDWSVANATKALGFWNAMIDSALADEGGE